MISKIFGLTTLAALVSSITAAPAQYLYSDYANTKVYSGLTFAFTNVDEYEVDGQRFIAYDIQVTNEETQADTCYIGYGVDLESYGSLEWPSDIAELKPGESFTVSTSFQYNKGQNEATRFGPTSGADSDFPEFSVGLTMRQPCS